MTKKEYHTAVFDHSDGLYRFALKLCKDGDMAHDLVQEAYENVWIKRETIQGEKVKSYLFRTVHNKFIDFTRKKKPLYVDAYDDFNPTTQANHTDLNEILHLALNQLPDIQKSAVLLRDYEGYSYEEISEILTLSAAQVKVYIFRARKSLQQYIGRIEAVI